MLTHTEFDPSTLRQLFACCPSSVAAICADIDGEPTGMSVSTFVPVSLDPPLAGIFIQNGSRTWPKLATAERFGISILGETNQQAAMALARMEGDRFASLDVTGSDSQALYVNGSALWIEGSIQDTTLAGDHFMVLIELHKATPHDQHQPLVFHRSTFRTLR